jgi:hypothetical protein
MVSKKSKAGKGGSRKSAADLTHVKADLKRLKKAGLYTGDLRKKPTRHAKAQVKRFRDVLDKKAKLVTAPTQKQAREYKGVFKTKFRKIVVPVRSGEKVFYSKKTGELFSYRTEYGRKVKRRFPKRMLNVSDLDNLPQGPGITYALPIGVGGAMERMTFAEVKQFAQKYSKSTAWKAYLEVIEDEDFDPDYEGIYSDE